MSCGFPQSSQTSQYLYFNGVPPITIRPLGIQYSNDQFPTPDWYSFEINGARFNTTSMASCSARPYTSSVTNKASPFNWPYQ